MSDFDEQVDLIIAGCGGRMGQTLLDVIAGDENLNLTGALEHEESPLIGQPVTEVEDNLDSDVTIQAEPDQVMDGHSILVDFTRPEATREFLEAARNHQAKLVIGTTGLTEEDHRLLEDVSEQTAIVRAPNMSVGINLLLDIVDQTTRCLGDDFDVEITEMHHRHKEDAPSGTANLLAERVAKSRHEDLDDVKKIGREGFEGERDPDEIGISSLRGGDVVGDHTVIFAGEGERIELTHKASSRKTFARGALRAAHFLRSRERGLFSMKEVLGL
jgi:4-hydroxy-tetrahydrodipicolinate reductase